MHVFQLPTALKNELASRAVGPIRTIVRLETVMKVPVSYSTDGRPIFGDNYVPVDFDVTDRIKAGRFLSLEESKPILPVNGKDSIIKAGGIEIELINPGGYIGLADLRSVVQERGWENTRVVVEAYVNGLRFPMFRGRINSRPEELNGTIRISARNELWKVVQTAVTFERFSPSQVTSAEAGQLSVNSVDSLGVKFYDGISVWNESGRIRTSVDNDSEEMSINRLDLKNGAKLGEYRIEFENRTAFRVTYPDNLIFQGDILTDFSSPFLDIKSEYWEDTSAVLSQAEFDALPSQEQAEYLQGGASGAKITFFAYKTMKGHPVDIVLNELEKVFTEDYGNDATRPLSYPIDYSSFDSARGLFTAFEVFVSETNKDNKVFQLIKGSRPLNVLQFCQRIMDHIGCQIIIDNYGMIKLSSPVRNDGEIFQLNEYDQIVSHRVLPTVSKNWFKFQYGWNDLSNSFGSFRIVDERLAPDDEKDVLVLNFPYYKGGTSDGEIEKVTELFMSRYLRSLVQIEIKLSPNWGLPMIVGDKVRVLTLVQPAINDYFEVYDMNKDIGGDVILKLVKIPEPLGEVTTFCDAVFCQSKWGE